MFEGFFPSYFEWWHIPLIIVVGLFAESFGAIVGGGGLLTLPLLLSLGVPVQSAIAVNTAAALGTEAGILSETRDKVLKNKKAVVMMAIPIFIGGIIGTQLLLEVPKTAIKYIVIVAITALLLNKFFNRNKPKKVKVGYKNYAALAGFCVLIGVYTNFIGAGEGTLAKMGIMSIMGYTFIQSHGIKSTASMPTRFYSLVVTAMAGLIIWPYLITKWCTGFIAGKYSTKFVKRVPDKYMDRIITTITVLFVVYLVLFYD